MKDFYLFVEVKTGLLCLAEIEEKEDSLCRACDLFPRPEFEFVCSIESDDLETIVSVNTPLITRR